MVPGYEVKESVPATSGVTLPNPGAESQACQARVTFRPTKANRLPGTFPVNKDSLLHVALKCLARSWDFQLDYHQHDLAAIPIPLKQHLLNYIMIYSGKNIDVDGLNLLISSEIEVESHTTTGCKELTHLNLSGSIRSSLTLEKLQKFWSVPSTLTSMTAGNSDLELFAPSGIPVMLPLVSRFPHLSYLSLLHPGCVSWPSFLRLAPNLVILTHLCLAYWPTLELDSTNNQHPHRLGRVSSDLNTKSDGDWSNAAAVLAILCKHSRQLRWLDLEGCAQWLPALTWHDNKRPSVDWNGAWGSVEYLNLSQGPMLVGVHLEGGSETTAWLQVEREIQHIEALIVGSRAEAGDGKISIDRGWEKGSFISYLI